MGDATKIEWTDSTFNPWIGCQRVSPGCDLCHAETWNNRFHLAGWGPRGERVRTSPETWRKPVKWNEEAVEQGRSHRLFCASLADVFDNQVPEAWRDDLWRLIRETPALDWQLLTKRPENAGKMLPPDWGACGYSNVWLGISAEDQEWFDRRWPILASTPAIVRFISYEPALGPLTLKPSNGALPDWTIAGGESGLNARLMDPAWARSIRDQCADLGVPFFMKQMTGKKPIPRIMVREFPAIQQEEKWK
jgi:protein gp37